MDLGQFRELLISGCGLVEDRPLLVGFSAGPDSLCLLDNLSRLSFPVIAAHFDHQLRPDSAHDAEYARQLAQQLNVPFVSETGDVSGFARQEGFSTEEAARALRYRFLFAQARRFSAQAVAVGHTADDQAETLLLHLLRGTGLAGLVGMRYRAVLPEWDAQIPVVRPLLGYWREEILACCQSRGLIPSMDPTNIETNYLRNKVRHEVIPFLEQVNPQVRKALWRSAQILSADADVLHGVAAQSMKDCQTRYEESAVGLRLECFFNLPLGIQRAVLRQAVAILRPAARDLDFAAIERGIAWANHPGSGQIDLVNGLRLFIEEGWVWIAEGNAKVPADWPQMTSERIPLTLPGVVEVAPGWQLISVVKTLDDVLDRFNAAESPWEAWIDADTVPGSLYLRRPAAGDRLQPFGMAHGTQKLSDFWVNQKLPRRARASWPLLVSEEKIVWIPGFRLAHPYRVRPETRRVVHLRMVMS